MIDPSTTTTPVQDGLDAADTASSTPGEIQTGVILPPDLEEQSAILPNKRQSIRFASGGGRIRFPSSGSDGIDLSNCGSKFTWSGTMRLEGPGTGAGTAFTGGTGITANVVGDSLFANGWDGSTVLNGQNMFQVNISNIVLFRNDPGSNWTVDNFPSTGSAIGTLAIYGDNSVSGTGAKALRTSGGSHLINTVTLGGSISKGVDMTYVSATKINTVNYEANNQLSNGQFAVKMNSAAPQSVGAINISAGTVDYAVDLRMGGGFVGANYKHIGVVKEGGGTVTNVNVGIFDDLSGDRVVFHGPSSEVDNTTGSSLSNGITCLSDLVNKTSTGTGP